MSRRLGRAPWLLVWAVLTGAQLYGFVQLGLANAVSPNWALAFGVLVAFQLVKLPFAAARLFDLGMPPDDALLSLVPLANLGLFNELLKGAPPEDRRNKRLAAWQHDMTASKAFFAGLRMIGAQAPLVLGVAVLAGILSGFATQGCERFIDWMIAADEGTIHSAMQVLEVSAGLLGLYLIMQISKARTATRASWLPTLILLPLLLTIGAMYLRGSHEQGLAVVGLLFMGLDITWSSFVGGLLAAVFLMAGARAMVVRGGDPEKMRARVPDVVAVHGGAIHAVDIGIQIVIPGIVYLCVFPFVDMVAMFEPETTRVFRRAAQLSRGILRRLFKVQMLGYLIYKLPTLAIAAIALGPEQLMQAMMDAREIPVWLDVVDGIFWFVAVAVIKLSLLAVFEERRNREAERAGQPAQRAVPVIGADVFAPPSA